jgi:hypothetical protein
MPAEKPRINIAVFGSPDDRAQLNEAVMQVTSKQQTALLLERLQRGPVTKAATSWQQGSATGWDISSQTSAGE